jgi:hypothetical protein
MDLTIHPSHGLNTTNKQSHLELEMVPMTENPTTYNTNPMLHDDIEQHATPPTSASRDDHPSIITLICHSTLHLLSFAVALTFMVATMSNHQQFNAVWKHVASTPTNLPNLPHNQSTCCMFETIPKDGSIHDANNHIAMVVQLTYCFLVLFLQMVVSGISSKWFFHRYHNALLINDRINATSSKKPRSNPKSNPQSNPTASKKTKKRKKNCAYYGYKAKLKTCNSLQHAMPCKSRQECRRKHPLYIVLYLPLMVVVFFLFDAPPQCLYDLQRLDKAADQTLVCPNNNDGSAVDLAAVVPETSQDTCSTFAVGRDKVSPNNNNNSNCEAMYTNTMAYCSGNPASPFHFFSNPGRTNLNMTANDLSVVLQESPNLILT